MARPGDPCSALGPGGAERSGGRLRGRQLPQQDSGRAGLGLELRVLGGLWGAAVPVPLLRAGEAALCAGGNCCVLLPCGQRGHWRRTPTAVLLG